MKSLGTLSMVDKGNKSPAGDSGTKQLKVMLAGGFAGAFSKTCTAPFGRMTILYQLGNLDQNKHTIWSGMRHVVATQGFFSLWRGHTATLLHRIPYSAVNFAVFENTKHYLSPFLKSRSEGGTYATETARYLIAGGAGGSVACGVAYPLDLIKTKMAGDLKHTAPQHGALIQYITMILRQEGISGLYKGFGATLTQVTPSLALNFTAYELSKSYISAQLRSNNGQGRGLSLNQSDQQSAATGKGGMYEMQRYMNNMLASWSGSTTECGTQSRESLADKIESLVGGTNAGSMTAAASATEANQPTVFENAVVSLMAGTVSAVVSSTATFPLDVVRRRLQVAPKNTSYMWMVQKMYAEGGPRAFYSGLVSEYLKVIPGVAIAFCTYEVLKSTLNS